MKYRGIPLIAAALLMIAIADFLVRRLDPAERSYYSPFMAGMMAGVLFLYVLYQISIRIIAWQNNRRDHLQ